MRNQIVSTVTGQIKQIPNQIPANRLIGIKVGGRACVLAARYLRGGPSGRTSGEYIRIGRRLQASVITEGNHVAKTCEAIGIGITLTGGIASAVSVFDVDQVLAAIAIDIADLKVDREIDQITIRT